MQYDITIFFKLLHEFIITSDIFRQTYNKVMSHAKYYLLKLSHQHFEPVIKLGRAVAMVMGGRGISYGQHHGFVGVASVTKHCDTYTQKVTP